MIKPNFSLVSCQDLAFRSTASQENLMGFHLENLPNASSLIIRTEGK
jgi:hypothetical protein